MSYANHIIGAGHVTIVFTDRKPINVLSDNPQYHAIIAALTQHQFDKAVDMADKAGKVADQTKGKFIVRGGVIVIDGESLPRVLSDRLIQFVDAGLDTTALENFWDNLKENPSVESKKDLFLFLEKNHIPLTEDGCFIGYKKVKDNFKDKHTGKIDNSPGKVVSMPRDKVNPNRNAHCSTGLHVADYSYAADGPMGDGRLLKVKVNPKDVVSVPTDYNARKMRVCRYQSLEEYSKTTEIPDQLVVEPESAKKVKRRVTKVKFKPLVLSPDREGRVRIPGKAVRQTGAGVGKKVLAYVNNVRSRNIRLVFRAKVSDVHASKGYKVGDDNSVRLSPSFLAKAKLDGQEEYKIRLVDGELELRAN